MSRQFWLVLTLVYLISFSNCRKPQRWKKKKSLKSPKRPHVVFVLADDLGYNDIGYHARNHGSQMYTPFLDSLAERGVKLENYYVQPVCSPTRGQLLTGRYQIHTGLVHGVIKATQAYGLPLDNILLPEQLQSCGYKTHMIGKWHLGYYKEEYLPWNRGFHTFYGFLTGGESHFTRYKCEPKKTRKYCGVDFVDSKTGPTNKTWGVYSTHLFLQKAKKILTNHPKNKPLFLYLSLQAVHGPLQAPRRYQKRFRHIQDKNRRLYGGMVLAMDKTLKRLAQHMKDLNMWKDTIFIFSTDNGGQTKRGGNNWPLRGNKGTLWEGGIRGVGFVHGKPLRLKTLNVTNNQLIHVSDWFPTIMSATSCPLVLGTQPLDGYNQWNVLTRNTQSKRTEILHNIDPLFKKSSTPDIQAGFDVSVHAAIRSGKWKLLTGRVDHGLDGWVRPPECSTCFNQSKAEEEENATSSTGNIKLFNIVEDPDERHEISAAYPEVVDLLLSRLVEYNASAASPNYPPHNRQSNPNLRGGFWLPWKRKNSASFIGKNRKSSHLISAWKRKKIYRPHNGNFNKKRLNTKKKSLLKKSKKRKHKYQKQYFQSHTNVLTVN